MAAIGDRASASWVALWNYNVYWASGMDGAMHHRSAQSALGDHLALYIHPMVPVACCSQHVASLF